MNPNNNNQSTTLIVSQVKVNKVRLPVLLMQDILEKSEYISKTFQDQPFKIIQSSANQTGDQTVAAPQGFVDTCRWAYNQHHHLTLDPNHVWVAILTQFSLYVHAQGELLRDTFVDFQGKRQLTIVAGGSLFTADFGSMANRMVDEQIVKNIKDPSVANWLLPQFSTTTPTDRVVASVAVMSALQKFFDYKFELECGLPSVTLEGTLQDWKDLRTKLDRLLEFEVTGQNLMKKWHSMLMPIFDNFVKTKEGKGDASWWNRICSTVGGGSGPDYISGWLSVFAVFDNTGKWQGDTRSVDTDEEMVTSEWPLIDTQDIPTGAVTVPVLIDDNGKEYHSKMFTGQFASQVQDNKERIAPRNDWCIAVPQSELH